MYFVILILFLKINQYSARKTKNKMIVFVLKKNQDNIIFSHNFIQSKNNFIIYIYYYKMQICKKYDKDVHITRLNIL